MRKLLPLFLIALFHMGNAMAQCNAGFAKQVNGATVALWALDSSYHKIHLWRLGDGHQAWGPQVTHTYAASGTYTIWHLLRDSLGTCIDSVSQTVLIQLPDTIPGDTIPHNPGDTIPQHPGDTTQLPDSCELAAGFTATPDVGNPANFSFVASPIHPAYVYRWYFGDGQVGYGPVLSHLYAGPGNYYVTLIVRDTASRCYDSLSRRITVQAPPPDSCFANFTYQANPANPLQVSFTGSSSDSLGGTYFWYIRSCDSIPTPDSIVYHTQDPVHTFAAAGCYRVCLYVVTASGCRRTVCKTLYVQGDSTLLRTSRDANFVSAFPNPSYGSEVKVVLDLPQAEKVKITVVNASGNVVYTSEKPYGPGMNRVDIPVQKLQRGLFYVYFQYGNTRKRTIFQKL